MKFLLDTSTCIAHLRARSPRITARLLEVAPEAALCSPVVHELLYGVQRSRDPAGELAKLQVFLDAFQSLPFDDVAAAAAASVRAQLAAQGVPIGPYDLQIASIALARGFILVTQNATEFTRVPGLVVQNWSEA